MLNSWRIVCGKDEAAYAIFERGCSEVSGLLLMLVLFGLPRMAIATHAANGIGLLLLVVALFTAATVILTLLMNRKP